MYSHRKANQSESEYLGHVVPEIASTYDGTCVVIGGGKSMWEDLDNLDRFGFGYDLMCINVSSIFVKRDVKHLFSWHSNVIGHFKSIRKHEFPDDNSIVHSCKSGNLVDCVWDITPLSSFSGLLAAQISFLLGYSKVILCGVPLDNSGYYYKNWANESLGDDTRLNEIKQFKNIFGNKVKSMSGRTMEIFGEPDKNWLGE